MKEIATNNTPPMGYPICTSESCTQRTHCLHALIAAETISSEQVYPIINAKHPSYQEGEECRLYRSDKPERYARGFEKAMRDLSHRNYTALTNYLSRQHSKTHFYRLKKGDVPLDPREQEEMLTLLQNYGYQGDAPFDRYEMRYTWE